MSGDMTERVTRAVFAEDYSGEPSSKRNFDLLHPDDQDHYRRMAQAAIDAMRPEQTLLVQRLYVALVEQRNIDGRKYGEFPYAPPTLSDAWALLDGVEANAPTGVGGEGLTAARRTSTDSD